MKSREGGKTSAIDSSHIHFRINVKLLLKLFRRHFSINSIEERKKTASYQLSYNFSKQIHFFLPHQPSTWNQTSRPLRLTVSNYSFCVFVFVFLPLHRRQGKQNSRSSSWEYQENLCNNIYPTMRWKCKICVSKMPFTLDVDAKRRGGGGRRWISMEMTVFQH